MTDLVFVEQKPMEGREHQLGPGATIGREGCDLVLADPEVSRRHAAVRASNGGVAIEDLGSTNGTYVNDQRIEGLRELRDGDVVRFGNTVLRLRADAGATTVRPVAAPQVTAARPIPAEPQPPAAPAPEPTAPQPAAPQPAAAPAQPPAAPQQPAQPAAPSSQPVGARGDVPAPLLEAPSAIRRVLPPDAASRPPAFEPAPARKGGSAATRVSATVICWIVVLATAVAIAVYFATF